jgi:hypothetical protein
MTELISFAEAVGLMRVHRATLDSVVERERVEVFGVRPPGGQRWYRYLRRSDVDRLNDNWRPMHRSPRRKKET